MVDPVEKPKKKLPSEVHQKGLKLRHQVAGDCLVLQFADPATGKPVEVSEIAFPPDQLRYLAELYVEKADEIEQRSEEPKRD